MLQIKMKVYIDMVTLKVYVMPAYYFTVKDENPIVVENVIKG